MLLRAIVALAIVVMLGFPISGNIGGLKNKVNDDQLESVLTLIDGRIVDYYSLHSGWLPSSHSSRAFTDELREEFSITEMDTTPFSYVKLDKDKFALYYISSKGKIVYSLNSTFNEVSKPLTVIEPETF